MKLYLKILFILFFINTSAFSYAQLYVNVPTCIDEGITSKMIDSLNKTDGITDFLLYLKFMKKNQINNTYDHNIDSVEATYFIWKQEKMVNVILITDSFIYKSIPIEVDSLFKYQKINKIWLEESEDVCKFVCPILIPYQNDIVIYISSSSKFFFEIGENLSYQLNPDKNKYRYEFLSLLDRIIILPTNGKWVKLSNYDRYASFGFPNN